MGLTADRWQVYGWTNHDLIILHSQQSLGFLNGAVKSSEDCQNLSFGAQEGIHTMEAPQNFELIKGGLELVDSVLFVNFYIVYKRIVFQTCVCNQGINTF